MALIINTNISSLNAQRQLLRSEGELSTAMERLSSGKKINSAADDAAGLALSNRMTSQIRGLAQAVRNANDGVSLIQTAEGALDESTNILQRMRELAIQSSNGIYSDTDRATLDAEVQQLNAELDRIAETTSFNGRNILDGTSNKVDLQVGARANETISFAIPAMDTRNLGLNQGASGELIGAELNLNTNGQLANELEFAAIKINGQSVDGVSAGATVQSLLDKLNDLDGISASTQTTLSGDTVGSGALSGGDEVTLTGITKDGSTLSLAFGNTNSLQELVDDINAKGGDNFSAQISDEGKLVVSSERMAKISVSDDTGGTASGMDVSTIADPDIAATINGLQQYWLNEAETLINTFYGLMGNPDGGALTDLTLNLDTTDGEGNTLASLSYLINNDGNIANVGFDLTLNLDMADFTAENLPNGGNAPYYNDRVIAHEIVHAVMAVNMNTAIMPGWFIEGTAELIHGADDRVKGDYTGLDTTPELTAAFKTSPGSPSTSAGYSASYLAVKMLHDDILTAGGAGIDQLFDLLEGGANSLSDAIGALDTALGGALPYSTLADYETHFLANGVTYLTGGGYVGSNLNLDGFGVDETDTGSIAGSDYGNPALNAEDVLPNTAGAGAINFNLIIPDEYAGTAKAATANLVLSSDSGDAISVALGANGNDLSLSNLGLIEVGSEGVLIGSELNASAQNTALVAGDLRINDVAVGAVDGSLGLYGKIDAINAVSDESGVRAFSLAKQSFEYDLTAATHSEFRTNTGGFVIDANSAGLYGFNGIGITVSVGETASDVASSINATNFAHGVTAYADDNGELHIQAKDNIVYGSNATTPLVFGTVVAADVGSIEINGTDITLSDIDDLTSLLDDINAQQGVTGVRASIDDNSELMLESASTISVRLGDENGLKSFAALGIPVSTLDTANEGLVDSDGDYELGDETFFIDPRIKLDAIQNQSISVDVSINGATATGLLDVNADETGFKWFLAQQC